jgi:hypothetical protein
MSTTASSLPSPPPAAYHPPISDTARWLGYAGLVPFVLGALLLWVLVLVRAEAHTFAALALSAYAALILSFLGGIHWGLAFRQTAPAASLFVWGVVPSLVAWMAVLMPAYAGLVVHGVMLVVCYLVDRRVYPAHGIGQWLTLRFRLSAVASFSCFLGAANT